MVGNYIDLFKKSIDNNNLKKAKDLLLDLHLQPERIQRDTLDLLAMVSSEGLAWQLTDFLVRIEVRHFNAFTPDIHEKLLQLLTDRAHLNFEFAIILYRTKDKDRIIQAAPLMKFILTNCTDREVLFETIHAAGRFNISTLAPSISEFIFYDDATLKAHAVDTLGKIATSEATQLLMHASQTVKNDRQIMDTLALLKRNGGEPPNEISPSPPPKSDTRESTSMERLHTPSIEERSKAFRYYIDHAVDHEVKLAANLKTEDHDLIINTLRIISAGGVDACLPDIYSLFSKPKLSPSIIYGAFEALCTFKKFSFTELMLDAARKSAVHVRMAAVMALNKNVNDPVYAKVKNLIETGRQKGELLVQTLIDAQAENLIDYLLVSDTFAYIASNYLAKKVHPSALETFLAILSRRGMKATSKKIEFKAKQLPPSSSGLSAFVLSTSDTAHRIFETVLFKNDYQSHCFKNPQDAFEALAMDKPDLLIMDLFFNEMTALDLAGEIRELYSKDDLPLLISSRQDAFLDTDFSQTPYADLGINGIFKFPELLKGIETLFKE